MTDDPYLGEIRLTSFGFAPPGWLTCNGQFLSPLEYVGLSRLLGTTYGSDEFGNFAVPDLGGLVAMGQGAGYVVGQVLGEPTHTLSAAEMPTHNHLVDAMPGAAASPGPGANLPASADGLYGSADDLTALHPATIASAGGGQPHENRSRSSSSAT